MSSDESEGEEFVLSSAVGHWEGTEPSSEVDGQDAVDPRINTILALITDEPLAEGLLKAMADKYDAIKMAISKRKGTSTSPRENCEGRSAHVTRILTVLGHCEDQSAIYRTCKAYDSIAGINKITQQRSGLDPFACAEKVVKIALAMERRGSLDNLLAWLIAYMQALIAIRFLMLPLNRAQGERLLFKTSSMEGAYSHSTETQFTHIFGKDTGSRRFRRAIAACRKLLRLAKAANSFGVVVLLGLSGYTVHAIYNWPDRLVKEFVQVIERKEDSWRSLVAAWPILRSPETEILSLTLHVNMIQSYMVTGRFEERELRDV